LPLFSAKAHNFQNEKLVKHNDLSVTKTKKERSNMIATLILIGLLPIFMPVDKGMRAHLPSRESFKLAFENTWKTESLRSVPNLTVEAQLPLIIIYQNASPIRNETTVTIVVKNKANIRSIKGQTTMLGNMQESVQLVMDSEPKPANVTRTASLPFALYSKVYETYIAGTIKACKEKYVLTSERLSKSFKAAKESHALGIERLQAPIRAHWIAFRNALHVSVFGQEQCEAKFQPLVLTKRLVRTYQCYEVPVASDVPFDFDPLADQAEI
jgi:hypothetical protein